MEENSLMNEVYSIYSELLFCAKNTGRNRQAGRNKH